MSTSTNDAGPSNTATGLCMCGGVTYSVAGELRDVWNCHCPRCRQFTGHHMASTRAAATDVTITSSETLAWYSPEPSVAYGFCNRCGSSLFWRTSARPEHLNMTAGSLQHPTGLRTTMAWWMAEHGDYHTPDPGLTEYDHDA